MTLQELIAAVYTETNRPDLVSQTQQSILSATFNLHTNEGEYFFRDISSALLTFPIASYLQVLDTDAIPYYRAMAYMRKYDPSLAQYELNPSLLPPLWLGTIPIGIDPRCLYGELELITPDDILDEFGYEKTNCYYQAGSTLAIKSNTSLKYVLAGWYQFPDITPAGYSSWIADKFPYAIIYEAAYAVLCQTDDSEQAVKYKSQDGQKGLAIEHRRSLVNSNITPRGR